MLMEEMGMDSVTVDGNKVAAAVVHARIAEDKRERSVICVPLARVTSSRNGDLVLSRTRQHGWLVVEDLRQQCCPTVSKRLHVQPPP